MPSKGGKPGIEYVDWLHAWECKMNNSINDGLTHPYTCVSRKTETAVSCPSALVPGSSWVGGNPAFLFLLLMLMILSTTQMMWPW